MWRRPRVDVAAVLVALAAALAWANALSAAYQFDDWNVIVGDPRVQSLAAWWDAMPGIRPLLKLSYAANHASGLGAAGFHAVNVAIHLANSLLVLALLRRWPAGAGFGIVAFVAALVFALHPVQTEAVTYASGRSASLAALFALSSLLAWVAGRERGGNGMSGIVSPLLFACALATRETVAVLPVALLLWRATAGRPPLDRGSAVSATGVHWLVLAIAFVAAFMLPDYQRFFATSIAARPPLAQALSQVQAVSYLAGQLVRPDRLNADPVLPVVDALTPGIVIGALFIAASLAAGLASLRRRPALAFGILWFFLWLAPTNSLLPRLDVVNDRQLYLALIGPAWLAGLVVAALWRRRRSLALAATAVLALGLGLATAARNVTYSSEVRFWQDVTAKTPLNARGWNNLGYAYALAGRNPDAERAFRQAIEVDPGNTKAAVNLALLLDGSLLPATTRRE